jgi:hypothetical protein
MTGSAAIIHARFERIVRRALRKADEEIQRARIPLGLDGERALALDDIARWPRRPPRPTAKLPRRRSRRRARPAAVAEPDPRARKAPG